MVRFVDSNADRNGPGFGEVWDSLPRQFLQLSVLRQLSAEALTESGGQGVAGSNPVVPTSRTRAVPDHRVPPSLLLAAVLPVVCACDGGWAGDQRVGAENPDTSCDLHVLVYEAAESISSQRSECCSGR